MGFATACGDNRTEVKSALAIKLTAPSSQLVVDVTPRSVSRGGLLPFEVDNSTAVARAVNIARITGEHSELELATAARTSPPPHWFELLGGTEFIKPGESVVNSHIRLVPGTYVAISHDPPPEPVRQAKQVAVGQFRVQSPAP